MELDGIWPFAGRSGGAACSADAWYLISPGLPGLRADLSLF